MVTGARPRFIRRLERTVDAATCDDLVALHRRLRPPPTDGREFGERGLLVLDEAFPDTHRGLVLQVLLACLPRIAMPASPTTRRLHPETVALVAMSAGESLSRHHDNGRFDADGHWVRNEFPQRCLSAVLYLNDDFEGGELVFDRQDVVIRPEPGLLVVFPSGQGYPHEVRRVERGVRYTMPFWFTTHRWHAMLPDTIPYELPD